MIFRLWATHRNGGLMATLSRVIQMMNNPLINVIRIVWLSKDLRTQVCGTRASVPLNPWLWLLSIGVGRGVKSYYKFEINGEQTKHDIHFLPRDDFGNLQARTPSKNYQYGTECPSKTISGPECLPKTIRAVTLVKNYLRARTPFINYHEPKCSSQN